MGRSTMQQRPAQQPMTQSAAEAERSGTFAVALPPGVSAGMRLAVAVPQGLPNAGATCEFDVPQGLKAGDIVQVPLPPEGYQPGQGAAQQQSQQPPAAAAPAQDRGGGVTRQTAETLFYQCDADNPGSIDFEELCRAMAELIPQATKADIMELFASLDLHKDGKITLAEWTAAFDSLKEWMAVQKAKAREGAGRVEPSAPPQVPQQGYAPPQPAQQQYAQPPQQLQYAQPQAAYPPQYAQPPPPAVVAHPQYAQAQPRMVVQQPTQYVQAQPRMVMQQQPQVVYQQPVQQRVVYAQQPQAAYGAGARHGHVHRGRGGGGTGSGVGVGVGIGGGLLAGMMLSELFD